MGNIMSHYMQIEQIMYLRQCERTNFVYVTQNYPLSTSLHCIASVRLGNNMDHKCLWHGQLNNLELLCRRAFLDNHSQ